MAFHKVSFFAYYSSQVIVPKDQTDSTVISQSAHIYPQVGGCLANCYSIWSDLTSDSMVALAVLTP